jgi:metal-sulfur cluster biosynthetic enzyme
MNLNRELIYEFLKDIRDPEKDATIEELDLIDEESIIITKGDGKSYITISIEWKPTTPNCSLALNIGLCMRYKLKKEIEDYLLATNNIKFLKKIKIDILLKKGSHNTEQDINKQLNDKERYLAAFENPDILKYINSLTMY